MRNCICNLQLQKNTSIFVCIIDNKRTKFASFAWILNRVSLLFLPFSVQPSACMKSMQFYTEIYDRYDKCLASYDVYKHYCIKICFAKGKHYLWKEFSFHEEESSILGTIYRIFIIQRYIVHISKVTCSPRHITEYVQGFHFPDRNNYKCHARIISCKEQKQGPEILLCSSYRSLY